MPAAPPGGVLARFPLFAPLADRNFRLYWTGRVVSLAGDQFQLVALAAVALDLTRSSSGLGAVLMVQAVPRALFMLFGGVATDRFSARTVMLISDALQALAVGALAVLAIRGEMTPTHLFVYAAVAGTVYAFFLPASSSIVPDLVPRAQVRSANALNSTAFNLTFFLVPPVAGAVIAAAGAGPGFAFNAVTFLVSAVVLWRIRTLGEGRPAPDGGLLAHVRGSLRAALADEPIWLTLVMAVVFMVGFQGVLMVALPALAKLTLEAGDAGVGILYGARGAGALAGSLVAGSLAGVRRQGLMGSVCILGTGSTIALSALMPTLWTMVPVLAVSGAFAAACGVVFFSLVQSRTPAEHRGGVMALLNLALFGITPLSFGMAGVLGDLIGPRATLILGGLFVTASGLVGLARRRMREAT